MPGGWRHQWLGLDSWIVRTTPLKSLGTVASRVTCHFSLSGLRACPGRRWGNGRGSNFNPSLLPRPGSVLQPDIDARRFPVVRLVEDVHIAVPVEVGDARFVEAHTGRQFGFSEIAPAVAVENPGLGVGIVRFGLVFMPFGHF